MDQRMLLMIGLGGVALVAIIVVLFPSVFGESQAEQRKNSIKMQAPKRIINDRVVDPLARRKQVADSLKEIDHRARSKKLTLETKLGQAGMTWSKQRFYVSSLILGVLVGALLFVLNGSPVIALAATFVGVFALPHWILAFLRNRRLKKFRTAFPDAIDIIIRGVKSGLPLGDCLRIVATESAEPVRSEFRHIVQAQGIGLPVGDAVDRLTERVPIPEANFFAIVIGIQQKAGGSLSEALGNLSRVLRDRKKMQGKIKAMSAEAKASAGIIGSLPFAVGFLVWLTSPRYIELLWTTSTGHIVMGGCLCWMGIGVAVIKKMISFDF